MSKITYIGSDGAIVTIGAEDGASVMQTAVSHGVKGIVGECGGSMMCSTCHVYVEPKYLDRLDPPAEEEDEMLDAAAAERKPNSRLSCQIRVGPELDGLVVALPENQY
ncbi:2Fe-2S iron-sulfur cluster-binding protein [Streptomyces sp. CA-249302]|uniref:2Fe-2S iron-sulfur cluster-binding protein n=1 Tax=Streptomyces sp. CA-249302 TaxID=3240058 RepID=UPI003D91D363